MKVINQRQIKFFHFVFTTIFAIDTGMAAGPSMPVDRTSKLNWGFKQTAAADAWRISKSNKNIVIAIIDTGVDVTHPFLKNNLWANPNEILNGKDDDGNGFIDDIHGWNFAANSRDLTDTHGHGTHVAGIVKGIAPRVRLMILKYYDPHSRTSDNLGNTVKAITYAVRMNANIINYSGGGTQPNDLEKAAIKQAEEKGLLFVAAAGNEKSDSDKTGFYPASYDLANIISVTAINKNENILESSNYGRFTVDVAAPGENIYSTLPNGSYGYMTGTSQATAFVSGTAALVLANRHGVATFDAIIKSLVLTNKKNSLMAKTRYGAQLDSYRALAIQQNGMGVFGVTIMNDAELDPGFFSVRN